VHESPWVMLGPLVILAVLSIVGGLLNWPAWLGGNTWFAHFLAPMLNGNGVASNAPSESPAGSDHTELILACVSTVVAGIGWLVAHVMYCRRPQPYERLAEKPKGLQAVLFHKYWVDEIYGAVIVTPVLIISRFVLKNLIDRGIIGGGTLAAGYSTQGIGALVARIQSGNIRSYAGWLALFAGLLLAASYFGWTAHFWVR
jgi:NADH-quinone oxidoreductase subunit L